MTSKRKAVQDYIIKYVGAIVSGNENVKLYEDLFKNMTDEEFDNFMQRMKKGEVHVSVVVPNDGKIRVSVENNFKVAKQLGHEFFQRVKVTNHPDYPDHLLPVKALTMILPVRRAQQLLAKKETATEMVRVRGGDIRAQQLYQAELMKNGEASQKMIMEVSNMMADGGVKSTKTLKQYFQAMHIKNTL